MDARTVQKIEAFSAFVDFLSNPAEYKSMMAEMGAKMDEWREINEKDRKIRDIDAWYGGLTREMAERKAALDAAEKREADALAKKKKAIADMEARLARREAELTAGELAVEKKSKELDAMLKAQKQLESDRERLRIRTEEVEKRESEVVARLARLNKAMEAV